MIKLTNEAVSQIKEIFTSQDISLDSTNVRVGIGGKSCSGTVYDFTLDDTSDPESDERIVQDGVSIVYKKQYFSDLNGTIIDFKEIGNNRGFTFNNPLQVVSEGGCCGGGCGGGGCGA
jgi:iron-sulfur cluster assembly accessory protein